MVTGILLRLLQVKYFNFPAHDNLDTLLLFLRLLTAKGLHVLAFPALTKGYTLFLFPHLPTITHFSFTRAYQRIRVVTFPAFGDWYTLFPFPRLPLVTRYFSRACQLIHVVPFPALTTGCTLFFPRLPTDTRCSFHALTSVYTLLPFPHLPNDTRCHFSRVDTLIFPHLATVTRCYLSRAYQRLHVVTSRAWQLTHVVNFPALTNGYIHVLEGIFS